VNLTISDYVLIYFAFIYYIHGDYLSNYNLIGESQPLSQPNMHEYYLVYPSEHGNNGGKKVPLSKHNIARDYGGKC
jgi:hypothetical protein